ncbi:MAG TPA: hypothetical protein VHA10_06635 [Hypericibacter adhaerens]|nr:hypothetical protein [Hypericibacter adhaerens]HWA42869.1 hypothetical protein [Hypericibacter adhaerens]
MSDEDEDTDGFMPGREMSKDEPGAIAHDRKTGGHGEPVLSTEEARSGETSGHLRKILGISIAMVTIAFGILLAYWMNNG